VRTRIPSGSLLRGSLLLAVAAKAGELDLVARQCEALLAADAREPFGERAALELDDALAGDAGEVVVVRVSAEAIRRLAAAPRERVDRPVLGQRLEGAVNGREPDADAAAAQLRVELLCARAVRLALELADDGEPLRGGTEARLAEQLGLRCGGHVA
jgi:hypothetical protein